MLLLVSIQVFQEAVEFFVASGRLDGARKLVPRLAAVCRHNGMDAALCKANLTQVRHDPHPHVYTHVLPGPWGCKAVLEIEAGDLVKAQESFMTKLGDTPYLHSIECKVSLIAGFDMVKTFL